MKKTAVVILNWNGRDFLEKFLPCLLAHTPSDVADIVVADNGSMDDSLDLLNTKFPDVKQVLLDRNYGFAGGYNRALEGLDYEYFVLLNSDIKVSGGWIDPLINCLESNDQVAAVQPKILSYDRCDYFEYAGASGGFIDALGYPFCRGRLINECEQDSGQYDDEREIFWASGAAFAVRASAFRAAGGFDDLFFAHMEEIDLCWRFRRMGLSVRVCPGSVVYHVGAGTLPVWSPRKTFLNFRNNIAMLYKNLSWPRFACVYVARLATDSLRLVSYLVAGKLHFAGSIVRGHMDFWRLRRSYPKIDAPKSRVGEIYRFSIVIYYLFVSNEFKKIL
ncbi:MAG: glycosyltransferase family 2 protein [Mucinivorans sp.]